MHLKKATVTAPKRDQVRKTVSLAPVKDLNKSKLAVKDDNDEGGGVPAPSFILPYTTTVKESKRKGSAYLSRSSYLSVDPQWQFENEYDPMYPNEYEKALRELRERRDREAEEEEAKRKQDEIRDEDELTPPPVSKPSSGGVAIAPPSFYNDSEPSDTPSSSGGNFGLGAGSGASAAARIMAKYGYKEGQGLGKKEQGMATALQVEKTSHRIGRIIHEKDEPKGILLGSGNSLLGTSLVQYGDADDITESENEEIMKPPSRVILLNNMVGPGEVDDELEPEVKEECQKYGEVLGVTVFQMPDVDSDEAIRIFVEFEKVDSASKALTDLHGRFFGGRQVKATYYDYDKFNNLELTE
jgi:splicing factor 45